MIVTVTMNPALDKTARLARLLPGELNRLEEVRVDAGGKGVNVGKMIAVLGGKTLCTGFAGGAPGRELCRRIDEIGIPQDFMPVAGTTRTNLKLVDAAGALTELNEPGIAVAEAELGALLEKALALAGPGGTVVLSGSLPRGAPAATYRRFARRLRAAGCRVIVDAEGEALRQALEAPPHVIKPNRRELLQCCGLPQATPEAALPDLCRPLLEKGVGWVVLSLGEAGAMFFTGGRALRALAPAVDVRSAVGAGDSMVGALAFALEAGLGLEETVRLAMACAVAAVTTEGTNPPALALVQEIQRKIEICEL